MAPQRRPPAGSALVGMARIARGKADGLAQFRGTTQAFLASLAPWLALPIVGSGIALMRGQFGDALVGLFVTLCGLLAPPVLSYEFARFWSRQERWLLYATAFNWCQWLLPVLGTALMLLLGIAGSAGLPPRVASVVLVTVLGGYGLWLHWFLARHALQLSGLRAALLVIGVNVCTVLLVLGPRVLMLERG